MDSRSNVAEGGNGGGASVGGSWAKAGPPQQQHHQNQHHNHHHHHQSSTSPVCGGVIGAEFSKSCIGNGEGGDASLDNPTSSVDTPQQDSGSNQSGSDSGLGYTNSISSDNSTSNNVNGQDRTPAAAAASTRTIATPISTTAAAATLAKIENNNITTVKNKGCVDVHITNSATQTSKLSSTGPASSVYPDRKSESSCFVVDETRTIHGSGSSVNNRRKLSCKDEQQPLIDSEKKSAQAPVYRITAEPAPSSPPSNQSTTGERCAPALKSLLKKASNNNSNIDCSSHPSSQLVHKERKRRITFNQTVIVFCEELGAPVLSGPDEHQQPFEPPPPEYQDPLCSFEPPEDYCDQEEVVDRKEGSTAAGAILADDDDDYIDKVGFHHPMIDGGASNLTDDQLFGLLENESLLETFKINCDEGLSDEDFPTGQLNKLNINDQSGLSNGAISDYDSDSESSLYYERKVTTAPTILAAQLNQPKTNATNLPSKHEQSRTLDSLSNLKNVVVLESQEQKGDKCFLINAQSKPNSHKTAPARVKVSTVDNSNLKRNSTKKEESDLKSKLETKQNENSNSKLLQHKEIIQARGPEPMLVRQSIVEPMAFSKPTIVPNLSDESRLNSNSAKLHFIPSPLLTSNKPTQANASESDELHNYHSQQQQLVIHNHKTQQPSLPNSNFNHGSDSQSCQICKVIESKKSKPNIVVKQQNQQTTTAVQAQKDETSSTQPSAMENQLPIPRPTFSNQQAVYNESCVSCREASMKNKGTTNINVQGGAGIPHNTGSSQQIRPQPLAYQLVYVVDQNGNRVKALSVVKSNLNTGVQQPMVGKRIFVAQNNNLRFPNPGSAGTGQLVNVSNTNQQSQLVSITGQPVQYKVVGTAQQYPLQQIQYLQNHNVNMTAASNDLGFRMTTAPALLPHTVYYVRQPLEPRTVNQSREVFGNSSKSFPDPHEIRRLDGIKGPTANLNLSNKRLGSDLDENSLTRQPGMSKDEAADDPTFGFSQRPSVKVVATTNSYQASAGNSVKIVGQGRMPLANNTYTICRAPTSGQMQLHQHQLHQHHHHQDRPFSVVVMGSQTLDRRHLSRQSQIVKENISSTSSMTNIHGTFANSNPYPPNKVSTTSTTSITNATTTTTNSQHQRISGQTDFELPCEDTFSKPFTKESRRSESDMVCLENNKGVIETGKVIVPLTTQDCQTSSLMNHRHRKTQEQQSEVLYSMNI